MKSIDDIKTISIDERTYEAARSGPRPAGGTIECTWLVTCYEGDTVLMVTDLDPVGRLNPAERTLFSSLLHKSQTGSRPFDLSQG